MVKLLKNIANTTQNYYVSFTVRKFSGLGDSQLIRYKQKVSNFELLLRIIRNEKVIIKIILKVILHLQTAIVKKNDSTTVLNPIVKTRHSLRSRIFVILISLHWPEYIINEQYIF